MVTEERTSTERGGLADDAGGADAAGRRSLEELQFRPGLTAAVPMDTSGERQSRQVHGAVGSFIDPTSMPAPKVLAYSSEMLQTLGIAESEAQRPEFAQIFAGNRKLEGMRPWAACYGGHQFGNWAGQLGDGRAITLGELTNPALGGASFELQLKGAGATPYSRGADGRAVVRSSVREFLCSEAMFHLGVPTTRALSLVWTGEQVVRDMFYDGNPEAEPGAIVCRVAPTFLRFGNFEIFAARRDHETQRQLLDYAIRTYFPHLVGEPAQGLDTDVYLGWYREVARTTAELMVEWMRVGFVHGVMNTDNLSILGLTIDYGPYGWLEDFDPRWTPNTTDAHGRRYAYGQQPEIGYWNLVQLGNALVGLVGSVEGLNEGLEVYRDTFHQAQTAMMARKLGLAEIDGSSDHELVSDLLMTLQVAETDMTLFYRHLIEIPLDDRVQDEELLSTVTPAYYEDHAAPSEEAKERMTEWLRRYSARSRQEDPEGRRTRMRGANPKYVLRNYLAQLAIDEAEKGDGSAVMELLEVLRRPYEEQPEYEERFAQKRPEWARHRAGCSMLSCSS